MSPTSYQTAPPRGGPITIAAAVTKLQVRGSPVSGHRGALATRLCAPGVRADVDDEPEDHDEPTEPGHACERRVRDRPPERGPGEEQEPEEPDPERVERVVHPVPEE